MLQRVSLTHHRRPISIFSAALLGIALSGCMSSAERGQKNLQADTSTCQSFGAPYGSGAYSDCMLEQQRRRDDAQRESLERTRLTTQIARDAQVTADRARKDRCDRNPARSECRR